MPQRVRDHMGALNLSQLQQSVTHGIYVLRKTHCKTELRCWSWSRDDIHCTITRHNLIKLSRSCPKTLRTSPDLRAQQPSVAVRFHLHYICTLCLEQPFWLPTESACLYRSLTCRCKAAASRFLEVRQCVLCAWALVNILHSRFQREHVSIAQSCSSSPASRRGLHAHDSTLGATAAASTRRQLRLSC